MNIRKLRVKMFDKEMNVTDLANEIGISRTALYRKLNKPRQFTIGEVMSIKSILGLTNEEAIEIFLRL